MGGYTGNGFDKRPEDINRKGAPKKTERFGDAVARMFEVDEMYIHIEDGKGKVIFDRKVKANSRFQDVLAFVLFNKALMGDTQAAKLLIEHKDGKPDSTLHTPDLGTDLFPKDITDEEKEQFMKSFDLIFNRKKEEVKKIGSNGKKRIRDRK